MSPTGQTRATLQRLTEMTPPFAEIVAANPALTETLPDPVEDFPERDYRSILLRAVNDESDFARRLAALRRKWSELMIEIVVFDVFERITRQTAKIRQTMLAEASLEAAILVTKSELEQRLSISIDDFGFSVLGLGKPAAAAWITVRISILF